MATASHYNEGPDSDKYIDEKCFPCTYNKKDQTADHYCYDCEKHWCKACLGIHNALFQNHVVVQGNRGDERELTEKCENHKELITLFCLQHKELMCIQCRRQDHRTCDDVKHIQETARQLSADTDLQDVTAHLQSALSNVQKSIEALDSHAASIQNTGSGFFKEFEDKLLSLIKEMREKGKGAIKSKEDQVVADVQRYQKGCVLAKDEVNRYLDDIKKPNQLKANLFIIKNKAQAITKTVDALHKQSDSWIKGHQLNITAGMKIMYPLKSAHSFVIDVSAKVVDMNSFGTVGGTVDSQMQAAEGRIGNIRESREKRGENPEERPREKRGENPEERPREKREEIPVEVPIKKRKRVDETVKRPGEKPSVGKAASFIIQIPEDEFVATIYGCCLLSDGCLLIADYKNSRLKRVDPSNGTVTKFCNTNRKPWDVCCIGPQEVAVAFFRSTKVHVYNTESLTETRTVELQHETTRIACHDDRMYCAEWSGYILYVHDVRSFKKLRVIRPKDTDGRKLTSITNIAVNCYGDRIYVTDLYKGLVCVSADGKGLFHLSMEDLGLIEAKGVTTDHHGHVFVCGKGLHNVVKVTEDGHVVEPILSLEDGIQYPDCLSYDVTGSKLYVVGSSNELLMVEWK